MHRKIKKVKAKKRSQLHKKEKEKRTNKNSEQPHVIHSTECTCSTAQKDAHTIATSVVSDCNIIRLNGE